MVNSSPWSAQCSGVAPVQSRRPKWWLRASAATESRVRTRNGPNATASFGGEVVTNAHFAGPRPTHRYRGRRLRGWSFTFQRGRKVRISCNSRSSEAKSVPVSSHTRVRVSRRIFAPFSPSALLPK